MDQVDAPLSSKKQIVTKQRYNPMQNELKTRLAQRRKDGLTYDLTSEESDVIEDDDGGDDDDDLSRFRIDPSANIRRDRPTSAKRRPQQSPSFEEETTRFGSRSDRFSKKGGGDSMPLLSPTSPKISPKDRYANDRFSPKDRSFTDKLSPKGDTMRPGDGDAYMKGRKSPYGEGLASLPKAHGASPRTKSGKSSPLTNEEMIFGKKTPEQMRQSPIESGKWQPPQYRKNSPVQEEDRDTSPGAKGRRTPQDALLAPIDEKPSPRQRKHSGSEKQRYKESPRNLNLTDSPRADQPKPRPRMKTEIFGKTQKVDVDIDDELEEINRSPGRFSKSPPIGRKTPTGYKQGRQTPTEGSGRPNSRQGRQTPTGRMEGRTSPSGRKTPTGKQDDKQRFSGRRTPVEEKKEKFAQNREPSLMDFLAGDASPEKPEKKIKEDKFEKLLSKKKKDTRGLLDDDNDLARSDNLLLPQAKPRRNQVDLNESIEEDIPDESSVCEELDREPIPKETQKAEEKKKRLSGKQTLENQGLNNAIESVATEQSKPPPVKHIDPNKGKKDQPIKIHKPKPRHSLPGTPASTTSETSEHMFEDTKSIRQAIYDEWKKERLKEAKKKLAEQKKKEQEEEKKKKEEKAEKIIENKASYNAWMENKKPELQQKAHEKKKLEDKEKQEEEEKEKKKKDALTDFLKWKEKKDADIERQKKQEAREKRRQEEEKEMEKRKKEKLNETALRGWTKKKEAVINKTETLKKTIVKEHKQKEIDQRKQQEEEALKRYNDWLQRKEKQQKKERRMRYGSQEDIDFRPPWSPANKTIPYRR